VSIPSDSRKAKDARDDMMTPPIRVGSISKNGSTDPPRWI
jgi:hypothetical protein